MTKSHYWVPFTTEDNLETSMSTTVPLVGLATATRAIDDTLIRFVAWAELVASVSSTTPPPWYWLESATVDILFNFDTESDGHAVNLLDADPYQVGFIRLDKTVFQTSTAGRYQATWQGNTLGLDLHGMRKGYSVSNLPSLANQRWVADDGGVFDNFAHYGVTFSSRVVGRALWASDLPPPP